MRQQVIEADRAEAIVQIGEIGGQWGLEIDQALAV